MPRAALPLIVDASYWAPSGPRTPFWFNATAIRRGDLPAANSLKIRSTIMASVWLIMRPPRIGTLRAPVSCTTS